MTNRFPKFLRLRRRHEYQRMSQGSNRLVGKWILIDIRINKSEYTRLGITVNRRFGAAHERNRFKRIVREAFRLNYSEFRMGLDLNVKPRTLAKQATTQEIASDFLALIGKQKDLN